MDKSREELEKEYAEAMTNDPSMTITSAAPAPEGSGSTSKEGNTIPLPVTEGINTPPAPDTPPPDMIKTVDGTTFDISSISARPAGRHSPTRYCASFNPILYPGGKEDHP